MAAIAGIREMANGSGHPVEAVGISDDQARFIAERGGVMTIYRAASVVG